MSVRVCLEWQPKMPKTWPGAVPSSASKKAKQKEARRAVPKKLRVALPVGVLDKDEEATLAHGVLVKGMAGGKREERLALLKAARQLGRATRRMGKAIGDEINKCIPMGEPLLSFGRGVNDDVDLMGTGKGVALHAAKIMITACARRRTRRRRPRTACWCSGPSACRAACSAARRSTRTSTRGPRTSTKKRSAPFARHVRFFLARCAARMGTKNKDKKRDSAHVHIL
jgi:hypothetical protein